ncbi:unnamed protein product [Caenorhabditis brenneri]
MRLMDLPILVQRKIIPRLEMVDVIELTMMSSKFHRNLRNVKIPIEKFQIFITTGTMCIIINKAIQFRLNVFETPKHPIIRKFNRKTVEIKEKERDSTTFLINSPSFEEADRQNLLESVYRHLVTFLQLPWQKFPKLIFNRRVSLQNLGILENSRFSKISICQNDGQSSVVLSPEDIEFILEKVKVQKLIMNVIAENAENPNFLYQHFDIPDQNPVEIKEQLTILDPSWVDFSWFWPSMNTESLILSMGKFSEGECLKKLNGILRQWRIERNEHLVKLRFTTKGNMGEWRNEVFEETSAVATRFRNTEISTHFPDIQSHYAMDIQSARNKRLITVILAGSEILMIVWNEKNLKTIGK